MSSSFEQRFAACATVSDGVWSQGRASCAAAEVTEWKARYVKHLADELGLALDSLTPTVSLNGQPLKLG